MRQRSEIPLIENVTAANRRHSLNARASRASGGFRFFAFTSSLLGCISLKTSILRVKVPLSPKTFYLPIVQQLRCEGNCLHLDGRGGLSAARQKRRRKMSLATAARRVKARGENSTPFAFTHNALCDRRLQRILTRVCVVNPSHATAYKSTDCKRKVKR